MAAEGLGRCQAKGLADGDKPVTANYARDRCLYRTLPQMVARSAVAEPTHSPASGLGSIADPAEKAASSTAPGESSVQQ